MIHQIKRKKKRTLIASASPEFSLPDDQNYAFADKTARIGIDAARFPSPEEENMIIISYRNTQNYPVSGRISFDYNEAVFPQPHFEFQEAYLHHGERKDYGGISCLGCGDLPLDREQYVSVDHALNLPASSIPLGLEENAWAQRLVKEKEGYLEQEAWSFQGLQPNEVRNIFISLKARPEMVKDTSVMIHLQAALELDNGPFFEKAILEIPIVAAHDPNVQQVNDHRVKRRGIENNKLKYKTRFQNTGEGPASTIKIETEFKPSDALEITELEVLDMYPKVPMCPPGEAASISCLDTTIQKDRLIFTFREVYLPGTKQEGVTDKDSTKGFVRYAIKPSKKIERRNFVSQASIIFDKEDPVKTNWAKTKFTRLEPMFSPMLGYRLGREGSGPAYPFVGIEVASLYKATTQPYVQLGLHSGFSGESDPVVRRSTRGEVVSSEQVDAAGVITLMQDSTFTVEEFEGVPKFTTLEIPVQIRRNFGRFIGVGAGVFYRLTFEKLQGQGTVETQNFRRTCRTDLPGSNCFKGQDWEQGETQISKAVEVDENNTLGDLHLFLDLTVGLFRAGPAVGARVSAPINQPRSGERFSVYFTWRI